MGLKQILYLFVYSLSYSSIQIPIELFGYTVNDISALILAYFVINYKLKGISVSTRITFYVFLA